MTPLRVAYDSTEYLVLAAWIADGGGFPDGASFPPGLPLLIAGLDLVGAGRSWGVVLMNSAFVAIGLGALAVLLRRDLRWGPAAALAAVLAGLLSSQLMRWTAQPLSEAPFIGLSFAALLLAAEARRRKAIWLLVPASLLVLAAIATRTFGVTLVPALIAGLPTARWRRLAAPAVALLGAVGFLLLGPSRYLDDASDGWRDGPLLRLVEQVHDLLEIAGGLAVNIPTERAGSAGTWLYPVVGVVVIALAAVGARSIAGRSPVLVTYVVSATALLLAWPLPDDRLALPVLPALAVCAGAAVARLSRPLRRAGIAWALGYAAVGVVALGVTTRISLSGDAFPARYGHGSEPMKATYRVAWGSTAPADAAAALPRTLWVLRRFEPRAVGDPGPLPEP